MKSRSASKIKLTSYDDLIGGGCCNQYVWDVFSGTCIMDILFDCRCSCNCSVRLRWVSVIYMAGSQNAFTMCGCIYPYSQHWNVDNNWYKVAPMWITFFHI